VLDRSKKRLALAFCFALFLHLPLTPAMPVLKLVQRITGAKTEKQAKATPPQEIEVELEEALRSEEQRQKDESVPNQSRGCAARQVNAVRCHEDCGVRCSNPVEKPCFCATASAWFQVAASSSGARDRIQSIVRDG
jgi:hypothetical protein